jgi:MBG domain (YGX type)/Bacterial Ig-like domain (group 3)/NHL repeat
MRIGRLSGVKVLLNLVSFAATTLSPTLAYSQALSLLQSGTRYAGTTTPGYNGDFGSATTLSLNTPSYIVFDSNGNQYISDTQNSCVRKITPSGSMSTLVGFASSGGDTCAPQTASPTPTQGLYQPTGLAVDSSNNLYIADSKHNCVRMLANGASGVASLTTVSGTCGSSASATPSPNGLVLDSANNLYISLQDTETAPAVSTYQVVRQAAASSLCVMAGAPSTLVPACTGLSGGVTLNAPSGLAIDAMGDLFIADTGNNCVRRIVSLTTYTTAAGLCANDSSGNAATALNAPYGLTFTPTQSLLITQTGPNNVVSYVLGSSTLSLAAGLANGASGSYSPTQDGTPAVGTPLNGPRGITADSLGNFYLADSGNGIARELSSNIIFPTTPVGGSSATMPLTFLVNQPVNLSASSGADFGITSNTCAGSLSPATSGTTPTTCQVFVHFTPTRPGQRSASIKLADSVSGKTVSQGLQAKATGSLSVFTPGIVNTAAGSLANPLATAVDASGDAYILEAGTTAGTADLLVIPAGGGTPQTAIPQGAGLVTPSALAIDATGNYFIADATHGSIARFGADGSVNTSYVTGLDTPTAVYADNFDNLYVAQAGSSHNVIEVYAGGPRRVIAGSGSNAAAQGVAASTASFVSPSAITEDLNGILYVADAGGHFVYAVDKSGTIHEVAGNGTTTTTVPGQATGTALLAPVSLAVDAAGDIYITDATANLVYTVFASTTSSGSNIAPILGTGTAGNTGDGAFANLAKVNNPVGVAVDGSANLFVVDSGNSSIREITYPSTTLAFGTITVGQTSPVVAQSLSNFGTDNLNLTASISTSNPQFTISSSSTTCGTTILAGSTCNLGFVFTPSATGGASATVVLASNSFNSPQPLNLTGTGQQIQPLQFTLPPQTEVYGESFSETVLVSSTNPPPTGTVTFSLGKEILCSFTGTLTPTTTCNAGNTGLSVGTYTVTFSYTGDSNYNSASGTTTLTVTRAPLTVTVNNASRQYGAANPTFTGSLTGVISGDTVLVSYSTTAILTSPVGNYPITATLTAAGSTNLSNYTITNNPGTLTITPTPMTITVLNASRQYGQANPQFSSTTTVTLNGTTRTGTLNGDAITITYSTTATITSPVGTYPINATASGPSSGNYAITVVPGTLTVTAAPLTVTVANASRPYGTPNPAFTSTVTGALNGDTFTNTYSTTATITSSVGTYPINDVVSGPAASNYTITVTPGTLTITTASVGLNVSANNETRIYGASNPAFTSTIVGALNGDTFTLTYSTTATATSPVGTYPILVTVSGSAAGNYSVTAVSGTLTVTPAPLSVTAGSASRAYGTANPTFTGTITGLVNGDTVNVSYSTTAVANSPVGTYPIVPAVTGVSANYALTTANGTLTITQNPSSLVINVNSAARVYGAQNPAFSGTVTGVLPGDDVVVTYSTSATQSSAAGNYSIGANVSGTSAANYIATIRPGTLAISPAATSTTVATSGSPASFGASVTFTASVTSSAGAVTGTVNFLDGATLLGTGTLNSSGAATFTTSTLAAGTHTINAAFQANTNFTTSSGSLAQVVNAPAGTFTIAASPATQFIKGAGATVYQVTLTSVGGFAGQINLACSGLPADASCTFASNPTLTTGGTATVAMTVNTTTADAKLSNPAIPHFNPADLAPITAAAVFPVELTGLGVFFAGLRRRKKLGTQKMHLLAVILFSLAILGLTGCGCPSTAFNNYTIVITGTSVSSSAPAQSTSVILSVGNQ